LTDITRYRATLFMESSDDPIADRTCIGGWLKEWGTSVALENETEYTWEVEGPLVALRELPRRMFLHSSWATYPVSQTGAFHEQWASHFDDGKALPGFAGLPPNTSLERTREG
jgi:hypothetical protein